MNTDYKIIELSEPQIEELENQLEEFDQKYITYKLDDHIHLGIELNGKIIMKNFSF